MLKTFLICCVLVCATLGCSSSTAQVGQPVSIKGTVTLKGQPLKGVAISLQPLEDGHMAQLITQPDGTFSADVTPGKYAYFIDNSPTKNKTAGPLPTKYLEADLGRTVAVEGGKDLQLAFD